MKPWLEWLLSVALILLVLGVLVALVVGFVRWVRPAKSDNDRPMVKVRSRAHWDHEQSASAAAVAAGGGGGGGGGASGFEFDLSSPKRESSIWKRRKRLQQTRSYTAVSTAGEFYKFTVNPVKKTIEYRSWTAASDKPLDMSESGQASIVMCRGSGKSPLRYEIDHPTMKFGLEVPGKALVIADRDRIIIGFGEKKVVDVAPGDYCFMQFSPNYSTMAGFLSAAKLDLPAKGMQFMRQPFSVDDLQVHKVRQMQISADQIKRSDLEDYIEIQDTNNNSNNNGNNNGLVANRMRVFTTSEDVVAIHSIDQSVSQSMLLIPQTPSADLPFPVRGKYEIIVARQGTTALSGSLEITAADGHVKLFRQDELMLEGTLNPLSHTNVLLGEIIDPCYGTFLAVDKSSTLVAQFSSRWCFLAGSHNHSHFHAIGLIT
jgi:hypothetical protein